MNAVRFLVVVAVALLASASTSHQFEFSQAEMIAHRYFKTFVNFLGDALQGRQHTESLFYESIRSLDFGQRTRWSTVNKFSFKNCAKPKDEEVVVTKPSLSPDPLKLPGNITAGGSVLIKSEIGKPLKVALDVHYKVLGFWVHVPCVDNVGSCTYSDVCSMIKVDNCPKEITSVGLTCECPFPAGNFTVAKAKLAVEAKLPISGDIKVKAVATQDSKYVTCAEVELNLA